MNRIIVTSLIILTALIALSLFLTSFLPRSSQQSAAPQITPIPTTSLSNSTTRQNQSQNTVFENESADYHFQYTNEEQAKINLLKDQMPYKSDAFDIEYSSELNQFYVQKKTPEADAKFSEFLEKNNLTEIAKNRGALFNLTTDKPEDAIHKVEEQLASIKKQAEAEEEVSDTSPDGKSSEEQNFTQSGKTLLSFNFGAPKTKTAPAGKGGGNCATGGYPFANRDQSLIGRPGQGTHSWTGKFHNWESCNAVDLGTPIGTPLCAIADGTITRVKMGNPNPADRSAGISIHLAVAGNEWWYAHLSNVAPGIAAGAQVKAGQIIGYTGAANNVPHLHLGLKNGNPLTLLGL